VCHKVSEACRYLVTCTECYTQNQRFSLFHLTGHAGFIHNCSVSVAYSGEGHHLRSSNVPFPRENTLWEEVAAIATMLAFFG